MDSDPTMWRLNKEERNDCYSEVEITEKRHFLADYGDAVVKEAKCKSQLLLSFLYVYIYI